MICTKTDDSHAMASVRIKTEFEGLTAAETEVIRAKARELFMAHNLEMSEKYAV